MLCFSKSGSAHLTLAYVNPDALLLHYTVFWTLTSSPSLWEDTLGIPLSQSSLGPETNPQALSLTESFYLWFLGTQNAVSQMTWSWKPDLDKERMKKNRYRDMCTGKLGLEGPCTLMEIHQQQQPWPPQVYFTSVNEGGVFIVTRVGRQLWEQPQVEGIGVGTVISG